MGPMAANANPSPNLTKFAWLSIAAAIATITLKFGAYLLTGSVGLLSDAAESVVNLVAAFVALIVLHVAAKPPDENHPFGHAKAEYFSAAVEGALILVAAVVILWTAVTRLINPVPLENVGLGLAISVGASVLNGVVAWVLIRAGRRHRSIVLEADGKHLLTDVWTSVGVVGGVLLVALTGWLRLDPIVAILVACNIVWTGVHLLRRSIDGLMDRSWDEPSREQLNAVLSELVEPDVHFHKLQTREAGRHRFVALDVLVPGEWTVQRGHDLCEAVEDRLRAEFDPITIFTHLEPNTDPAAYNHPLTDAVGSPPPGIPEA